MLSEAETYPDWTPHDAAEESTPTVTEPRASATPPDSSHGWGIPDVAPIPSAAPAWAGFSEPAADTEEGPSFWASSSNTPASLPSWNVSPDDSNRSASAAFPIGGWGNAESEDTEPEVDEVAEHVTETVDEPYVGVDESPFHEVAAAFAAAHHVPVAEREAYVPAAGRWDESAESADSSDEPTPVVVAEDVAVAVETNRRSRLPGRRKVDRAAGPDTMAKAEAAEPAVMVSPHELAESSDKAARSGFFTKKPPSTTEESGRDTPKVLRIAALASLLVGVGLFGYTVVNGRRSTPTAPAVTIAPPAPTATLAPVPPGNGTPVSAPAEDPIFGNAPAVQDDGLSFDTTANFGS